MALELLAQLIIVPVSWGRWAPGFELPGGVGRAEMSHKGRTKADCRATRLGLMHSVDVSMCSFSFYFVYFEVP